MSTTPVSSQSIFQELQSFYQNRQTDLQQLGSALQSGDLNGAQQAYSALAALGQSGPFGNSEPFSKSGRAQDFATIGQDLQAGDLAGAQAAFAALTSKQNNSPTSAQATPSAVVTLSTPTGGTSAPPIDNASSIYQQLQAYRQQRTADLNQLGKDLQAGNATAAQQDYTNLIALGQNGPNANGQLFQRADRAQDFQAIGQALQSGDLAGAQSAFASLVGTFNQQAQAAISAYGSGTTGSGATGPAPVVPPVGSLPPSIVNPPSTALPPSTINLPDGPSSNVPEIIINLGGVSSTGGSSASATPELVINLQEGNSSSASPEEIIINLGSGNSGATVSIGPNQGQNGNAAEQVIINLNQQSNNELILNLLNSNAVSQAQSGSSNPLSVQA